MESENAVVIRETIDVGRLSPIVEGVVRRGLAKRSTAERAFENRLVQKAVESGDPLAIAVTTVSFMQDELIHVMTDNQREIREAFDREQNRLLTFAAGFAGMARSVYSTPLFSPGGGGGDSGRSGAGGTPHPFRAKIFNWGNLLAVTTVVATGLAVYTAQTTSNYKDKYESAQSFVGVQKEQLENLKKEHATQLDTLKNEHVTQLDGLKKEYAERTGSLKRAHAAQELTLRATHGTQRADLLKAVRTATTSASSAIVRAEVTTGRYRRKVIRLTDEVATTQARLTAANTELRILRTSQEGRAASESEWRKVARTKEGLLKSLKSSESKLRTEVAVLEERLKAGCVVF